MILTLPYPPTNNLYYRHARGRTYLSAEGRGYRLAVLASRPRTGWPLEGRLRVKIEVHTNRGRMDLDNVPKCICDSLQHATVYRNDSQIDDLHIVRMPKSSQDYVVVTLEPI